MSRPGKKVANTVLEMRKKVKAQKTNANNLLKQCQDAITKTNSLIKIQNYNIDKNEKRKARNGQLSRYYQKKINQNSQVILENKKKVKNIKKLNKATLKKFKILDRIRGLKRQSGRVKDKDLLKVKAEVNSYSLKIKTSDNKINYFKMNTKLPELEKERIDLDKSSERMGKEKKELERRLKSLKGIKRDIAKITGADRFPKIYKVKNTTKGLEEKIANTKQKQASLLDKLIKIIKDIIKIFPKKETEKVRKHAIYPYKSNKKVIKVLKLIKPPKQSKRDPKRAPVRPSKPHP